LGMLAPATSALSFYAEEVEPSGEKVVRGVLTPDASLIFGMNPRDSAINKVVGVSRLSLLGATSLGHGGKEFSEFYKVKCALETNFRVTVTGFDFSRSSGVNEVGILSFGESHDWSVYMHREKIGQFLTLLFDSKASATNMVDAAGCER